VSRIALCALALVAAVGLSGCLSIKSQGLTQTRAPGVVTLGGVVCGSDYNHDTYTGCQASNVAELDNRANNGGYCDVDDGPTDPAPGCQAGSVNGLKVQLLVGFRVPVGSDGPDSFFTDARDLQLSRSASYTQQLQAKFPAPAGEHWVGYISTVRTFASGTAAESPTGIHPEFTLPAQPGGAPFPGPYHWRWVVGFRNIASEPHAGDPVSCGFATFCVDSPPEGQVSTDLPAENASDFGVLPGSGATAAAGGTATVAFPVRYLDTAGLGARDFALTASTNLPGGGATPAAPTLHSGGGTSTVNVSLPVPAGTPLGAYTVTLSATTGSPAVTRSNTAVIQVVDRTAPRIGIGTPAEGARFVQGRRLAAAYSCADEFNGSGLASCAGPVAPGALIDTRSPGTKAFTVRATDRAGNVASATHRYVVVARPPGRFTVLVNLHYQAFRRFTRLGSIKVKRVPRGATVRATCQIKRHKCPRKARRHFVKRHARGTVSLNKRYRRVRLRPGTRLTIRVTKPHFIGDVKIVRIRRGRAPTITDRCLPPGAKHPRRRC
jgi:hypothetical protein